MTGPTNDPTDDRLALLAQLLAAEGIETPAAEAAIAPRTDSGPVRAADAQELIWLLDRGTPGMTAYNIPMAFRLKGPLQLDALERSLDALVRRHEALRTVFQAQGEHPVLVTLEPLPVTLSRLDVGDLPSERRELEVERLLRERAGRPFDLGHDLLLRATSIRVADDDHLLLIESHHITLDGWSIGTLLRELSELYNGFVTDRPANLPPIPIRYRDFAAWQREQLEGPRLTELLDYWRVQLAAAPASLDLPTDRPRAGAPAFEGAMVRQVIPPETQERLGALGQKHGATMYMVLLAGYQAVLHRLSGQNEIVTGSASAGRTRPETEGVLGYFANTLALRLSFEDDPTFETLLQRARDTALGAYDHQEIPLERLVLELRRDRVASHAPLYQCVLTMQDVQPGASGLSLHGIHMGRVPVELGTTKFDLTLFAAERPEGIRLSLLYRTDLFDAETAARVLGHLVTLLTAASGNPAERVSRLPMLAPDERAALQSWNATAWDEGPPATVAALAQCHAARVPSQAAVLSGDGMLRWGELNAKANRLAHYLIGQGAGPGVTVGLCLERSTDLIVGMLGILKAGAAYVPLLPDLPAARLAQQVRESGTLMVVTRAAHRALLPPAAAALCLDTEAGLLAGASDRDPVLRAGPADLAYVLFTSGSTGVPKAVAVTNANLVHYTRAIARVLGLDLGGSDQPWRCATVSTLGADLGHTALFPALCSGGTVQVVPAEATTDGARFAEWIAEHPIDLLKITPNHFRALSAGGNLSALLPRQWLVFGGEACPWELAEEARLAGPCRVLNHYGPTETTVGVCTHEVVAEDPARGRSATVPIGTPIANTRTYVREARGALAPLGVPGELFIGGAGVTRGYLHRDDLTRERFVPDADLPGTMLYRTGDRVRRLPGGDLEFLGRVDDQVKLRGYRVELGEIESVLTGHPMVRQVAVVLRDGDRGDPRLVAYVATDPVLDLETVRRYLSERLPEYMVPARWIRLDALPLNPNGKVDRRALPAESGGEAISGAPQGLLETRLAAIWAAVLKRDAVGRDDDFFALGGHSLLAIRLLGRLAKEFGTRLPLRALFEAPTVARLAVVLEPRHALEEPLTALWREVLKRDSIGRDEDFFALGGHSLLAIRLLGRIAKQFTVRLPLRTLFDHPTVARLAPLLAPAPDGAPEHAPKSESGITRRARVALEPAAEKPGE